MTTTTHKLTKLQRELLEHRIDLECIADCLADTEELAISLDDAKAAEESVRRMIYSGDLPLVGLSRAECEVLADCLDGSTFFAGADDAITLGEETRGRILAAHKAANELETLFSTLCGRRVDCVRF